MPVRFPLSAAAAETPFVPTDLTGLLAWIDFSDPDTLFTDAGSTPVSSDGDAIYQANDKSGNGNNATQATSASRPLYKVNIQNSLSASYYDNSNDYLNLPNLGLSGDDTISVHMVVNPGHSVDCLFSFSIRGSSNQACIIRTNDGGTGYVWIFWDNELTIANANIPAVGSWSLVSAEYDPTLSQRRMYSNSFPIGNDWPTNANWTDSNYQIGMSVNSNVPYSGYFGELYIFDRILTIQERGDLSDYINDKWSLY